MLAAVGLERRDEERRRRRQRRQDGLVAAEPAHHDRRRRLVADAVARIDRGVNTGSLQSGDRKRASPTSERILSDPAAVRSHVDEGDEHHDGGRAEQTLLGDLGAVRTAGQVVLVHQEGREFDDP